MFDTEFVEQIDMQTEARNFPLYKAKYLRTNDDMIKWRVW